MAERPRARKQNLTEESFEAAGRYGLTFEQLAALHSVTPERVRQIMAAKPEMRQAYDRGSADVVHKVRQKAIEMALAGNITAVIWVSKQYGWSDSPQVKQVTNVNVRYVAEWDRPAGIGDGGHYEIESTADEEEEE